MNLYTHHKLFVLFCIILSTNNSKRIYIDKNSEKGGKLTFLQMNNPIITAVDVVSGSNDGRKEANFGGGNIGAYYNFMYPDNSDYPWACVCNTNDFMLWKKKELPYVRCRNQEDLSLQDIQANCDPTNVTNYEDIRLGALSPFFSKDF